jgi:hypothetical protein
MRKQNVSTLQVFQPPTLYKRKRNKFAWCLYANIGGKNHYFVSTNKKELVTVWAHTKHEAIGYACLVWVWLDNGKVLRKEITSDTILHAVFSDPHNLLV